MSQSPSDIQHPTPSLINACTFTEIRIPLCIGPYLIYYYHCPESVAWSLAGKVPEQPPGTKISP